jgi:hypothetical protein
LRALVYQPEGIQAMKTTQAWAWLVAAVLAAGLNASYHNGGLQWAHDVADRVEQHSGAVLALASGHADSFLSEARMLADRNEAASCRVSSALARVQARIARSETTVERFDGMSAREQAQLERFEASRARMEAQIARQTAHIKIATAAYAPLNVRVAPIVCPRIRVNVSRLPMVKMPALPVIHIDAASAGPV